MIANLGVFTFLFAVPATVIAAWWLTGLTRRYALRREMLDIPNQRSSHSVPTPRGGGVAIVIVASAAHLVAAWLYPGQAGLVLLLGMTLAGYATLGWLDDHYDLSTIVRLLVQLLLALAVMSWLIVNDFWIIGDLPAVILTGVAIVWMVWMANLYNFMDGIDGIAAVETLVLAVTAGAWFGAAGSEGIMLASLAVAGAAIGFLGWNWAPAKIFMGDVGSVSLGAFFALLALLGASVYAMPFSAFVILYGVFLVDASVTLLRRVVRGEKWWQAHRSHYYQRLVQSGWSHARVSTAVLIINVMLACLASALVAGMMSVAGALLLAALILGVPLILIDLHSRQLRN